MIVDDKVNKEIDKKISKGMKPGFWAGVVSFLIAKMAHLLITFTIGLWVVAATEGNITKGWWDFIKFVDSPLVGIVFLVIATRFIYLKITK